LRDEDGRLYQPDIVVNLPNKKSVIIDAKVSLTAYERLFKADNEAEERIQRNLHLQSIRQHVKGLSQKDYSRLYGIHSLDYVLLFLASEAAFQAAINEDPNLINDALQQNIMLVSPSNLMIALKTINNIWQTEKRINMSHEIAEQASKLHSKLAGYVEEMEKVGKQLNVAQNTYDTAMKKLSTGRGSIVSMGNRLQEMGVKTQKTLPSEQ
ncbi:MAG: DNA recombination protein RmuC, partial [Glaciecola sp.]|jgi:DNA recombination protein RmuC